MTTPKQMAVRMNDGHAKVLVNLLAGNVAFPEAANWGEQAGMFRGATKVMRTLLGWGAVEFDSAAKKHRATETGKAALRAYAAYRPHFKLPEGM